MPGHRGLTGDAVRALAAVHSERGLAPGVLVAVSGGPDSLALLLALAPLVERYPVYAATVDHGLRLEAADEARHVAALSAEAGIPHATLRWRPAAIRGNLLGAAREARYRLLAAHARARGAGVVLAAHHRLDQIETHCLLRERGARGSALAGMRDWRDLEPGVALVRPFLRRDPTELADAVRRAGWRAVDDPSNHDMRFGRVRLRRALASSPPDATTADALDRAGGQRAAEDTALAGRLRDLVGEGRLQLSPDGDVELRTTLAERIEGLPARLLSRLVTAAGGGAAPPPSVGVERLRERLHRHGGATLGGCHVRTYPDRLVFGREFGREGPQPAEAGEDGTAWFDRRFLVAGLPAGDRVEGLGGRRTGGLRPALRGADGSRVPIALDAGAPTPGEDALRAVPTVGWRLWADLPGCPPSVLTPRLHFAANADQPVGKDLAATYLA